MSNVSQHLPTNTTNSVYYGTTDTSIYQQPQSAGGNCYSNYGSSSSQHMAYWSGQSGGYANNQTSNYFPSQQPSTAAHPSSHWYKSQGCQPNSGCYVQNHPQGVATSNSTGVKRMYSNEAPLHDITNNAYTGAYHPKRRKFASNNTYAAQVRQKGVQRKTPLPAQPSSVVDHPAGKVRIESIFRHVELMAQSHWQTGRPAGTVFKPTTVDAFEGGSISTH